MYCCKWNRWWSAIEWSWAWLNVLYIPEFSVLIKTRTQSISRILLHNEMSLSLPLPSLSSIWLFWCFENCFSGDSLDWLWLKLCSEIFGKMIKRNAIRTVHFKCNTIENYRVSTVNACANYFETNTNISIEGNIFFFLLFYFKWVRILWIHRRRWQQHSFGMQLQKLNQNERIETYRLLLRIRVKHRFPRCMLPHFLPSLVAWLRI